MLRWVSFVSGVWIEMKSARANSSSRFVFLYAQIGGALRRQIGIKGQYPHFQALGAVGDYRANILRNR